MDLNGKIKVLQIAGGFRDNVDGKPISGGVASFLFNYYKNMDKTKYSFDFLTIRNQCFELYRDRLEAMGSSLYSLNIDCNGIQKFFLLIVKLYRFLKKNNYDIVHVNMGSFFPVLECCIASKLARVKVVIAHSHSTGKYSKKKRIIANFLSGLLTLTTDARFACSVEAAENLYSAKAIRDNNYIIIKNAIDVNRYKFDKAKRNKVRRELGINDEIVLGHVGRFVDAKNHEFLINSFKCIESYISNVKLLLVGNGELKEHIEQMVEKLGLAEKVIFTGQVKEPERYYQAMDIFVMPSVYEGFPVVALEAQGCGLPCVISKNVTQEAKISENCFYESICSGTEKFSKAIINIIENMPVRTDCSQSIINTGFDLDANVQKLEFLYEKYLGEKRHYK